MVTVLGGHLSKTAHLPGPNGTSIALYLCGVASSLYYIKLTVRTGPQMVVLHSFHCIQAFMTTMHHTTSPGTKVAELQGYILSSMFIDIYA